MPTADATEKSIKLVKDGTMKVLPGHDLVVAINVNGGAAGRVIDDLLTPVLAELAGIRLPPRTEPPAEPVPFTPQTYVGSYGGPLATYEVTAAEGGRDVTETPKGFAAEVDAKPGGQAPSESTE